MSYELGDGKKHFQKFYLNNTAISELPENTFEDITFDSIQIVNAYNLSLIHTFAFSATNLALKNFYVANTLLKNSPPNYDIFTAMSLMFGIEGITIVNSKIQNIPDNAFRPILGQQKNLTVIYMYGNIIKMIGNNAFQYLPSLFYLDIYSNQINYIPKNVFKFLGKSLRNFHLNLRYLPLNSSSFEYGAFSNLNRPTNLLLGSSYIKYLDQMVFEPFFNNNDQNTISMNSIDCEDCRSFWLFINGKFSKQITGILCSNGKKFIQSENFSKCADLFRLKKILKH
jgi:hypothetical protein